MTGDDSTWYGPGALAFYPLKHLLTSAVAMVVNHKLAKELLRADDEAGRAKRPQPSDGTNLAAGLHIDFRNPQKAARTVQAARSRKVLGRAAFQRSGARQNARCFECCAPINACQV